MRYKKRIFRDSAFYKKDIKFVKARLKRKGYTKFSVRKNYMGFYDIYAN